MAWFARSIANSLLSPEDADADADGDPRPSASASPGSRREDLSELTDALTHRFHGLHSRFRAGLARLPGRQAVVDLAKIASSLLPPDEEADGAAAAGVTEEVVAFSRDAAMRPELWLDFPLLPDDADSDDFDMTDAQQDHALAVESLVPELADLRIELYPSHMSEVCFWKIYFVPNLRYDDSVSLSVPCRTVDVESQ